VKNGKGEVPPDTCEHCGYKLAFLMQLYSNLDEEENQDLHRMLYLFTCVSSKCIGKQQAIRVYRGYESEDAGDFAPESLFNQVYNAQSDQELIKAGLLKPESAEPDDEELPPEDENGLLDMRKMALDFEEFAIETDVEPEDVTRFYLKESRKLQKELKQGPEKK
jgi:hypothetical protein